jgi:hypothetical protein
VQFAAAAVTIQSCWRSHHVRLRCRVADAALAARAATVIQRAWKACERRAHQLSADHLLSLTTHLSLHHQLTVRVEVSLNSTVIGCGSMYSYRSPSAC